MLSVVFACLKFRTHILGYPLTIRSDHKSISFLKKCKLNHGRLTRWILILQEYNIHWEYVPGKQNIVADGLSRVNIEQGTYEFEQEDIGKVFHILQSREDLERILEQVKEQQINDPKLNLIKERLSHNDPTIIPYYCILNNLLFNRTISTNHSWKLYIPPTAESSIILDYHIRYGHMGPLKVVKAIKEHMYIKGINKKVRQTVRSCKICQMVKINNERKEGARITITSNRNLEKIFIDLCGPFPRSGGRSRYKYIVIILDHFSKFTKLYPISKATTQKVLNIILNNYIPEVGKPETIITDHGTQFKGKKWRITLLTEGIKTYKTSVYHPSSNPAERVLREVGRILRTYCHAEHRNWSRYVEATETFLNLAYHETIGASPYQVMFNRPPPREITSMIEFPPMEPEESTHTEVHNRVLHKAELQQKKEEKKKLKIIHYNIGDQVLIRNRQLPSTVEGITKKLLLLYNGPFVIARDKGNNTYELTTPGTNKIKGTYNQTEVNRFYEK